MWLGLTESRLRLVINRPVFFFFCYRLIKMRVSAFLVLATLGLTYAYGFGGSEEKFIKKYAMMKVYESCFGLQVLKEVRKEMKEAAQKCAGFQNDFDGKFDLKSKFIDLFFYR